MNGIEKITQRIDQDAQGEIDQILADAPGPRLLTSPPVTRSRPKKRHRTLWPAGEKNAAEREERLASVAQMEAKKLTLATKQEMLEKAFDLALDRLVSLPDDEYVALLADLAVKAAVTGREQLIFSQKDRTRVGKQVVAAANEKLAKMVAPELPEALTESKAGAILDKVVAGASAILAGTRNADPQRADPAHARRLHFERWRCGGQLCLRDLGAPAAR